MANMKTLNGYGFDAQALDGKSSSEYASAADVNQLKNDLNAEKTARKNADDVLSARMDAFTELGEGSTTGDAELMDIRVGADGKTYTSAGEAVRRQIGAIKSDLDELDSIISEITVTNNLFDKNDSDVLIGQYIGKDGSSVISDSSLGMTGYIYIKAYVKVISSFKDVFCLIYDTNKNFIGAVEKEDLNNGVYYNQDGYYRFLFDPADIDNFYVVPFNDGVLKHEVKYYSNFKNSTGVAFGTSLTFRAKTTGGYLNKLEVLSGITFDNQGIAGSTILQNGDKGNILNAVKNYSSYSDKKVCLIEGFVNDWYHNTSVELLGTYTDETENTVCGCVRSALNYIKSQNPYIKIFLILDHYGQNNGVNCSSNAQNTSGLRQYEYYEEIAKVAESMGVIVIKGYIVSGISERTPQYLSDDIHLTELGANQSGQSIWDCMKMYSLNAQN